MPQSLCEVRLDIPLAGTQTPIAWEKSWRKTLSVSRLSALASAPAVVVSARACVCGKSTQPASELAQWLPNRLRALPGNPAVSVETLDETGEWQGVKVWLSYSAESLPALLRRPKKIVPSFVKGRRP